MKLMVVGGGGREHAIVRKLKENPAVTDIFVLPGNGGIAADAVCVPVEAKDIKGIVDFAQREKIDFAVVAPDDPLVLGAVDALEAVGIPCFGPNARAAIIADLVRVRRTGCHRARSRCWAARRVDESAGSSRPSRCPAPVNRGGDRSGLCRGGWLPLLHRDRRVDR